MKQKNEKTLKTVGAGFLIALATTGIVLGCVKLFGVPKALESKHDLILKELAHVEFDKEFFKDAKREVGSVSGSTVETFTYEIPESDYVLKVTNGIYEGTMDSNTPTYSFEKDLILHKVGGADPGVCIYNLKSFNVSFEGYDKKENIINEYFHSYYSVNSDNIPVTTINYSDLLSFDDIVELKSITFYGHLEDQPKPVKIA